METTEPLSLTTLSSENELTGASGYLQSLFFEVSINQVAQANAQIVGLQQMTEFRQIYTGLSRPTLAPCRDRPLRADTVYGSHKKLSRQPSRTG